MEPKITAIVKLKEFLEKLLNRSVDIVRMHKHINPFLLKEIEKDGTLIF
jgi:predicted nucleotidyltransferase